MTEEWILEYMRFIQIMKLNDSQLFLYPATQKVAVYYVTPSEPFECPSVRQRFVSELLLE